MTDEADYANDPDWLTLPLARREVALHRSNVMLQYEHHEDPGEAEVQDAARLMGVTTGQFYRLRRKWLESRSIFSLIPYGKPGAARKPKLDKDVSDAVTELATRVIVIGGVRTPIQILKYIQSGWTLDKPIPSHMTLRKSISAALEKLTDVSGNLVLSASIIPQDWIEAAKSHGDVVLVDHIPLGIFVASPGGPVAPIATFVIDLCTSSICGFHLSFGAPGPLQFEFAIEDAVQRSAQLTNGRGASVMPRLAFQCSFGSDWAFVLRRIVKSKTVANVVKSVRPQYGDTVVRLIGNSIGSVKFASRRSLNDLVFDPVRDPLISLEELRILMEADIRALNEKRIPADMQAVPIAFDFLSRGDRL